jgi:hypothetical protein
MLKTRQFIERFCALRMAEYDVAQNAYSPQRAPPKLFRAAIADAKRRDGERHKKRSRVIRGEMHEQGDQTG